jgi:hypothetical protein
LDYENILMFQLEKMPNLTHTIHLVKNQNISIFEFLSLFKSKPNSLYPPCWCSKELNDHRLKNKNTKCMLNNCLYVKTYKMSYLEHTINCKTCSKHHSNKSNVLKQDPKSTWSKFFKCFAHLICPFHPIVAFFKTFETLQTR